MIGFGKSLRALVLFVTTVLACSSGVRAERSAPFVLSLNHRVTTTSTPKSREQRLGIPTRNIKHLALNVRGGGSLETLKKSLVRSFLRVSESKPACWIILVSSILLEGVATSLSKNARDKASPILLLAAISVYIPCMLGFFVALAKIEVGIAYACWSALGTLIVSTVGIMFFGESADKTKLFCLAMITAGVVGLNLLG